MSGPGFKRPAQKGYSKVAGIAEDEIVFQNAPNKHVGIINASFDSDDEDEWGLSKRDSGKAKEPRGRTCGCGLGRVLCGLVFLFLGVGLAFGLGLFLDRDSSRRAGFDSGGKWAQPRVNSIDYVVAPPPGNWPTAPPSASTRRADSAGGSNPAGDEALDATLPSGSGASGSAELAEPAEPGSDPRSPDVFTAVFNTTVGVGTRSIVVRVTRALAPVGADRFYALVLDEFFDQAAFFRVVPKFVVQFGISGVPEANRQWATPLQDDPVKASNLKGTITYATAGPNTRTTQLFINTVDNAGLDAQGFAPFGHITEGLDVVDSIYNPTPGSGDGVDQDKYTDLGNEWILKNYPKIDFITKATIIKHGP